LFGGFSGSLSPNGGNGGGNLNALFRHALAMLNSNSIPWRSYGPPAPESLIAGIPTMPTGAGAMVIPTMPVGAGKNAGLPTIPWW
jgi:hypothetical protein